MSNEIRIITPEQVELHFQIAGPGSRLLAMLVDQFAITVITVLIFLIIISLSVVAVDFGSNMLSGIGILIIIYTFLPVLYYFLFETFLAGRTPGKLLLGLRVIRDTGHALDMRGCLIRNLLRLVDQLPLFYMVGSVVVFFSSQSRRIGDYVGGTLVVRDPEKMSKVEKRIETNAINNAASQKTEYVNPLPESVLLRVGDITKDEYRAIRHLLDRASELDSSVVNSSAWRLLGLFCDKMQYDITQIKDPLQFLFALANEWERRKLH